MTTEGTSSPHLPYLDGWRGLAIGFLLVGHFFPVPGINFGSIGVSLFFVLSGLLMSKLLFEQLTPISTFYRRRISRIIPAHLAFIVFLVSTYTVARLDINWSEVVVAALFLNNYFPVDLRSATMPFGHIWSLAVEEHSYILLAIVASMARRKWIDPTLAVGLLAIICVACGISYAMRFDGRDLVFRMWIRTEVSAYGLFLSAFLFLMLRRLAVSTSIASLCPALVGLGIMLHWWWFPAVVETFLGVGCFALAVNFLPSAPKLVQSVLSFKPLCQLGIWSFSIYLWQQPFYVLKHKQGIPSVLALTLSVIAGLASFYLIENPARRLLNRVWGGGPQKISNQN